MAETSTICYGPAPDLWVSSVDIGRDGCALNVGAPAHDVDGANRHSGSGDSETSGSEVHFIQVTPAEMPPFGGGFWHVTGH